MQYRVDVSGWRRVQATVEVEASDLFDAHLAAVRAARDLAPFVWETVEEGQVTSIEVDSAEERD